MKNLIFENFDHFILAATANSSLCRELMEDTEENEISWRKTCPCVTLATINPTWTSWNLSLALRGEKPATTDQPISISQKPIQKHRKQQSLRKSFCSGHSTSKMEGGIFKLFTPQRTSAHLMVSSKDKKFKAVIWNLNTEALYYIDTLVSIYKASRYYL